MQITVTFRPVMTDALRSGFAALRMRRLLFASAVGFFIVIPWVTAGLTLVVAVAYGARVSPLSVGTLLALPPIVVAAFALIPLRQVWGAPSLRGPHVYRFSDADIFLTGPGFENRCQWSMFTQCYASSQGLLFLSGRAPTVFLPTRAISQESAQRELGELLRNKGVRLTGRWN